MPMEQFITDLAKTYGFQLLIVVDKDSFVDLQVMVLPEELRGRGNGSKFMEEVCAEADRRDEVLGLYPEGQSPQGTERLVGWYEAFGFCKMPDHGEYRGRHVRPPRPLGTD